MSKAKPKKKKMKGGRDITTTIKHYQKNENDNFFGFSSSSSFV
jgi:hypothetical protein